MVEPGVRMEETHVLSIFKLIVWPCLTEIPWKVIELTPMRCASQKKCHLNFCHQSGDASTQALDRMNSLGELDKNVSIQNLDLHCLSRSRCAILRFGRISDEDCCDFRRFSLSHCQRYYFFRNTLTNFGTCWRMKPPQLKICPAAPGKPRT